MTRDTEVYITGREDPIICDMSEAVMDELMGRIGQHHAVFFDFTEKHTGLRYSVPPTSINYIIWSK